MAATLKDTDAVRTSVAADIPQPFKLGLPSLSSRCSSAPFSSSRFSDVFVEFLVRISRLRFFVFGPDSLANRRVMAPHPYSRYRLRLFHDFVRLLVVPTVTFAALLSLTGIRLGYALPPAWLAFLILSAIARNLYFSYDLRRQAERHGGRLPPQVVGKWPGNLDVAIALGKAALNMYPGDFYKNLFDEYQCTTLNLKLFWTDMVRSLSPPAAR